MATGETKNITGSLTLEDRFQTTIYDDILTISSASISLLDPAGEIFTDRGNDTVTVTDSTITDNSGSGAELMFSMGSDNDSLTISNSTLNANTFMGSGDDEVFVTGDSQSQVTISKKFSLGSGNDILTIGAIFAGNGNIDFGEGNDTLVFNGGKLLVTGSISALTNLTVTGNGGTLGTNLSLTGTEMAVTLNGNLTGDNNRRVITISSGNAALNTANNIKTNIRFDLTDAVLIQSDNGTLEFDGISSYCAFTAKNSTLTLHDIVVGACSGAFSLTDTLLTVRDSNFSNNWGTAAITAAGGRIDLTGVGISNNQTGINFSGSTLTGADVSFTANRNHALNMYNGNADLTSAYFSGNYASACGGAIAHESGDLTLNYASFCQNFSSASILASADSSATSTSHASGGAVIYNGGDLTIVSASFSGNYASAWGGATALWAAKAHAYASGGAIAYSSGNLIIASAFFSGNYTSAAAAAWAPGVSRYIAGTSFQPGYGDILHYATRYGSASSNSHAVGGAIVVNDAVLNLSETTFSGNYVSASSAFGGAIAAGGTILNLSDVVFLKNYASSSVTRGGAIYLDRSAMTYQVSLNNDVFNCGNWADSGGFLYLDNSTAVFDIIGTLTIGDDTGKDSFSGSSNSSITKSGTGVMTVNSDISGYAGAWNLANGILKLERIARTITLNKWTIGVDAELHLSALNDTITMGMDKKIGIIDLGGGSDTINTGGYHLSGGKLRVSTLTLSGGGRVSSEITTRTAGEAFDITLNNVVLASNITGGNGADQLWITQSSEFSGLIALGNGSNTITASSGTVTTFSNALSAGKGDDIFSFYNAKFLKDVDLGQGSNKISATGSAVFEKSVIAGTGDDIFQFGTAEFKEALSLSDGNNKITTTGSAVFGGTVETGSGNDTLTFGAVTFSSGVNLGSGNDTITLKGDSAISGVVALGGGKNYIYNSQNLDFSGSFKLDSDGETHLIIYNGASLTENALTVYANEGAEMISTTLDWNDIAGLDKVRILVSSDATFETFEFTVELYNQTKSFTLNMEEGYFIQFQAQDEDGWAQRLLTDKVAPGQVGGFAMTGTTANWEHAYDNVDGNGVKHYNIQVAADADFNSLIGTYTSTTNSYSFASYADGNYFIRIQAEDYTGNKGEWSNVENLLIDTAPPAAPSSVSGSVEGNTLALRWNASTAGDAKEYKIEISASEDFAEILETVTAADTTCTAAGLPDGTLYFRVQTIDNVGNAGDWSSVGNVMIDTTAPSRVTNVEMLQEAGRVTLHWGPASDDGSGVEKYIVQYSNDSSFASVAGSVISFETSALVSGLDGTYYFRVQAADKNGNTGSWSNAVMLEVDGLAPTVPGNLLVTQGKEAVVLSWAPAADANGVKEYEYLVSSDESFSFIVASGKTNDLNQSLSGNGFGDYFWKVRAIDNYGNVGNWSDAETFSIADTTEPQLTISGNPENWTDQPVVLSAEAADAESGVRTIEFSTDNRTWKTGSSVTVSTNGTVYFRAIDNNGNVAVESISVTKIDTTAPTFEISQNTEVLTNQDVILSVEARDEASGIDSVQYSFDHSYWVTGSTVTVDSNKTVYFKVTDNAGNVTEKSFAVSNIDKIAPAAPAARADITGVTSQNVTVSASFSSDTAVREYSFDNAVWYTYTTGIVMTDNGMVYFRGTDAVGNISEVTSYEVRNIDRSGPDAPEIYVSTTKPTNKNVTVWAEFPLDSRTMLYSYDQQIWYDYDDSGIAVSRNGIIYFKSIDAFGNSSEITPYEISNIDKIIPPTPEEFTASIVTGGQMKLDWEDVTDRGTSGVSSYEIRYGASENLSGNGTQTASSEITLSLSAGVWYYQVRTLDKAGNKSDWSDVQTFAITLEPVKNLQGNANGLSWDAVTGASGYVVEYSTDNFATVVTLETTSCAVDSYALPAASFKWRVRAVENTEWSYGTPVRGTGSLWAQELVSDSDSNMDLFFGNANGVWGAAYAAQHLGSTSWRGTREKVLLEGKNRIADIFEGSRDANILVLTDDANGDALFVDDIYTALGDQARFAQIDEIRAGAGDDIVDMTSQRYTYTGDSIKIYGGSGDDTIWGGAESNTLFGDGGNDRLVGGSGNDVIVGGSGNDSMHGGGGDDIFTFGADWGSDTVKQLASGSVTLWFESGSESNWNAQTLTYSDGVNSVTVTGTTEITLKFGSTESAVDGAFLDAASGKVFEDKNKGFIA